MIPIRDNVPAANVPVAMWAIIGVNVLAFFGESSLSEPQLISLFADFGVVPARYTPTVEAGAVPSLLVNMFLHGGILRLIGNMCTWTHDHPITVDDLRSVGYPATGEMPREFLELLALYPQPTKQTPSVEYIRENRQAAALLR